jgi:hypothetical protein
LGIGGAGQLVLQLAQASVATGAAEVEIWTTRINERVRLNGTMLFYHPSQYLLES